MSSKNFSLLFFVVYLAAVTVLFLSPNTPAADTGLPNFDKIAHGAIFLFLSLLLFRALKKIAAMNKRVIFTAVISLTGYGLIIEILQYFTGRSPEAGDLAADITGVALGTVLSIFFFD